MFTKEAWTVEDRGSWAEVIALVDAAGGREVVAMTLPCADTKAISVATFIAHTVNDWRELNALVAMARAVLDGVLEEGLTFSTESELERVRDELAKRAAVS